MVFAFLLGNLPGALCKPQPREEPFADRYGFFDVVKQFPDSSRIESARNLYKNTCRKLAPAEAMVKLNQLTALARDIRDKKLECAVYDMRADYYSVNDNNVNPKSTFYHVQAINFARENKMVVEEGIYLHRIAIYYFIYKQNTKAINYILRALDAFKRAGYSKVPDIGLYFFEIADFYYDTGDFDNARKYALESLKYKIKNQRLTINTINTIGLIYRHKHDYGKALSYFHEALDLAKTSKDSAWIGISTGNIGSVYFMQKRYNKALPYLTVDYRQSIKYGENFNAAMALLRLISISIEQNKLNDARQYLDIINSLKSKRLNYPEFRTDLYKLKSEYYEHTGKIKQALDFRKLYEAMADSVKLQYSQEAIERVKLKFEQEKYQQLIVNLRALAAARDMRRNVIIGFVILIAIIIGLIYNRRLIKAKTEGDILKGENKRVDQELKNAEKELLNYTQSIDEKNKIINGFKDKIEQLNVQFSDDKKNEQLNNLLRTHIMTDANWAEFKRLFGRVYPGFFQRAKDKYPLISETDLRLMALTRLEIDNRTMASMLGITSEGVKKARQRLRKKIDLSSDTSIDSIVSQL